MRNLAHCAMGSRGFCVIIIPTLLRNRENAMPTQEERLATLERKIASLELELLYEQRKAEESTPSERAYNLNEVNHHLTMLLGIASGQERDMKIIKGDLSAIKNSQASLEQRFMGVEGKLEQVVQLLTTPPRADD